MNILLLTNKLPFPPKDGGSIATLNMIRGYAVAGFGVTCLSLNTSKHYFPPEQIPDEYQAICRFLAVDCDNSIKPLHLLGNFLFSRKPYIAQRFRVKAYGQKLAELLKEENFQIVQMEGPYLGHYIPLIREHSGIRLVLRAHNVEHLIWMRKAAGESMLLKKWYFRSLSRRLKAYELRIAGKSDCLICISPVDEKLFASQGIQKPAITIPTGLNLKEYPFSPPPESKTIFFIGALDWLPNEEGLKWFLDHVFYALCQEEPELRFHVAGRNAPPQVEQMFHDEHIIYHGEVEDARVFMQSYRVMVAPLFTGSGIRIKILEAMALGRPVVTTPVGIEGIPAIAGRDVEVQESAQDFKNQIIEMLSDKRLASDLTKAARSLVQQNFDTFELSNRLSRFLKEQV